MTTEKNVCDYLRSGAITTMGAHGWSSPHCLKYTENYEQRNIITASEGFVMVMEDGSEFQVTITQSKLPT